jgi:phenylacetate-CoA ligase
MISVAEYLPPETRELAEECFGGKVIDILSSSEAGVIAIQCPVSHQYHIQSEVVLAEIINSEGRPCQPGEVGELIVTPLYNYAIPLIRYRSGDFVMAGQPCSCGRTLPTIARIVGRREHMFVFPDRRRMLPPVDRVRISQLLGHDRWQVAQTKPDAVVLRFVGRDLSPKLGAEVSAVIREGIGDDFQLRLQQEGDLPLTSGGKRHHVINAMTV